MSFTSNSPIILNATTMFLQASCYNRHMEKTVAAKPIFITIPYSKHLSKNRTTRVGRGPSGKGIAFVSKEVKAARKEIEWLVRSKLGPNTWPQAKTWVRIFVQKPTHASDAINVIDNVVDGIRDGLGLDDNWYAIEKLDWSVVRKDPMVFIEISTKAGGGEAMCILCMEHKPLEKFRMSDKLKTGIDHICKTCRKRERSK